MLRKIFLGTAVLLTLTGCARLAESRINPLNWFGPSQESAVLDPTERRPLIPEGRASQVIDARVLVQSVTSVFVDRTPNGAIVRATGLAPTQGFFNAELVEVDVNNGVLLLEFRAQAPRQPDVPGSERSRQISAGFVIDAATLAGIRSVQVQAASNARTAAR